MTRFGHHKIAQKITKDLNSPDIQWKMFFGHDLKLQTGFTETSDPVLIIFPFRLALMRQGS